MKLDLKHAYAHIYTYLRGDLTHWLMWSLVGIASNGAHTEGPPRVMLRTTTSTTTLSDVIHSCCRLLFSFYTRSVRARHKEKSKKIETKRYSGDDIDAEKVDRRVYVFWDRVRPRQVVRQ